MADETTYASEMNQPAHRPGMEGVVNRAAPQSSPAADTDPRDASGNRTSVSRPTVAPGKTDPFSVRGAGAPKSQPAAATAGESGTDKQTNQGISGIGGRTREAQIMDAADKANSG